MAEQGDAFNAYLRFRGFVVTPIAPGDVNLYRTITTFLYGSDSRWEEVRVEIRDHVDLYLERFAYYINDNGVQERRPEVNAIFPGGNVIDKIILAAASDLYGIVLEVFFPPGQSSFYSSPGAYRPLMLSKDEEGHFNILTMTPAQAPDTNDN